MIAALERAERLADAGWGPAVHGLKDGFLAMSLVRGCPLDRRQVSAEWLAAMAEYLAFVREAFPAEGACRMAA